MPRNHTRAHPNTGRPDNRLWTADKLPRHRPRQRKRRLLNLITAVFDPAQISGKHIWKDILDIGDYYALRHTSVNFAHLMPSYDGSYAVRDDGNVNPAKFTRQFCEGRYMIPQTRYFTATWARKTREPQLATLCSRKGGEADWDANLNLCAYLQVLPRSLIRRLRIRPHFACRGCHKRAESNCNIATNNHERIITYCRNCSRQRKPPPGSPYCKCPDPYSRLWLCADHRYELWKFQLQTLRSNYRRILGRQAFHHFDSKDRGSHFQDTT